MSECFILFCFIVRFWRNDIKGVLSLSLSLSLFLSLSLSLEYWSDEIKWVWDSSDQQI